MSASVSAAINGAAIAIESHMVTAHAGRLIRMSVTYGEAPAEAARRALAYVMAQCPGIEPDLVTQIARACLAEAESEAAEQERLRS